MSTSLSIRRALVDDHLCDVSISGGRIVSVVPHRAAGRATDRASGRPAGVDELDAGGGALIPGLHDHHLHLAATAAAWESVDLTDDSVPGVDAMTAAIRARAGLLTPGAWVRVVGYHEQIAGDLDRTALDRITADRPVRVQHRSGAAWFVNTPGLQALGLLDASAIPNGVELGADGQPNGRLFRLDDWMRDRLAVDTVDPLDLAPVARELVRSGVTGCTDATPWPSAADVEWFLSATRDLPITVRSMRGPAVVATGANVKIVLGDHELPDFDDLTRWIDEAHRTGTPVAVHAVTAAALAMAIAAWSEVGVLDGDRVEHAAVVPSGAIPILASSGVQVVTQPGMVAARGDSYRRDTDLAEVDDLWRCGSLLTAGVPVGAGSDAPYGPIDPWIGVATAIHRRTTSGLILGSDERVDARRALDLWLAPLDAPGGAARRVAVGAPADLCLLDGPLDDVLVDPGRQRVVATVIAGTVVHHR